jgi:hypothetical protein
MSEDLLTRIQRETHERLRELRGAVDEHDRLQGELVALDVAPEIDPEPRIVPEPLAALDIEPEASAAPEPAPEMPIAREVSPEPSATSDAESGSPVDPEPSATVVRLPARPHVSRTRIVSPKVARLMRAPRRPALERAGVMRVGVGGAGASAGEDLWPREVGEEIDAEAEIYERAL